MSREYDETWKLVNTDETQMYFSILQLMDLLDKNREDYEFRNAVPSELLEVLLRIMAPAISAASIFSIGSTPSLFKK